MHQNYTVLNSKQLTILHTQLNTVPFHVFARTLSVVSTYKYALYLSSQICSLSLFTNTRFIPSQIRALFLFNNQRENSIVQHTILNVLLTSANSCVSLKAEFSKPRFLPGLVDRMKPKSIWMMWPSESNKMFPLCL